jgi:hypothetical protein
MGLRRRVATLTIQPGDTTPASGLTATDSNLALVDNVALNRLHLLPNQLAAIFGQLFAIRPGR